MLVVYFSRTGENYNVGFIQEGNTAKMAKIIAAQTGADLFEIVPEIPYTKADLNWMDKKSRRTRMPALLTSAM